MKRIIVLVICFLTALSFAGCESSLKKYDGNISELRTDAYAAENGGYTVKAISGRREEPFEIDGISSDKQIFTVITLEPPGYNPKIKYTYKITLGENDYTGDFVKHPFNNTYSAEIGAAASGSSLPMTYSADGKASDIVLQSVIGENFITAEKALDIGLKKLRSSIKQFKSEGASYEIYVRLIENPINASGGYYWYVAFVGSNDVTYAVLIEPVSMDIMAIRN